jgi:DNA polymerase bacteriophage-type
MTNMLYLDLETRSQCDLIFHGLAQYARDETTEVICMAYCFDDEPMQFWWSIEEFPSEVSEYLVDGGLVMAHNAEFEMAIFEHVLKIPVSPEQWRCSMAIALTNNYPAALAVLAENMGIKYSKQQHGTRLIREYCAPHFLTEFKEGDRALMKEYCATDVEVMREAVKFLRPLTDFEWDEWHLNVKINKRGIPVDVEFCEEALTYSDEIAADANAQLSALTGGKMTKHTQRKSRDEWLFPKLTEPQMNLLVVYKKGEKKYSLDQDHRGYLLALEDLDPDARQLLEHINDAGSSALKKYAVAAHCHVDGRVHNTFRFNGAGTGRFSGMGLQPHNIRRDAYSEEDANALIKSIKEGYVIDAPSTTMARLLRSMISSDEGLYYVDWSAIEGRVAPWLAEDDSSEAKLDLYRKGLDVYIYTASRMTGIPEAEITKDQRQSGKVAELALQFGGGVGALNNMARNYGLTFSENEAQRTVRLWRSVNPWAEKIWAAYDRAIRDAVLEPGLTATVGLVSFQSSESFLWCKLPSGRMLAYPRPRWETYETPWGEERRGPTFQAAVRMSASVPGAVGGLEVGDPTAKQTSVGPSAKRNHLRGALIFQNTVQAVAADILREAVMAADTEGLSIIGHVHDEIIGEGPREDGEILNEIMLEVPEWGTGLPLATGGVEWGYRYGK